MQYKFPLANSPINNDDIDDLVKWLQTYPRLTMGKLTREFEEKWAKYIGTSKSVFVNSGSSANTLMVYSAIDNGNLAVGDKDEVGIVSELKATDWSVSIFCSIPIVTVWELFKNISVPFGFITTPSP